MIVGSCITNTLFNIPDCGSLVSPSGGSMAITGTYYLDVATFSCDAGFELVGSQQLVCQYGGSWDGSHPICTSGGNAVLIHRTV